MGPLEISAYRNTTPATIRDESGPVCDIYLNHPRAAEYAKLFVAALELREACNEFMAYDESNCTDELHSWAKLKDMMVAAIAKATGQ